MSPRSRRRFDVRQRWQHWQTLGMAAAGQIAHWTAPEQRASFLERAARELGEAGSEVAAMLLDGSWRTPEEELDRRFGILGRGKNLSEFGTDPFGYSPATMRKWMPLLDFLYRVWFRVEAHGVEHVPEGRCLIIGNHSGQLPFDAVGVAGALLLEREPPRMVRSMVAKFATALPFFGPLANRWGQITGLPDNCRRLLEADEAVLVFPEGERGVTKPFRERYKMTAFGQGFLRLALETRSPIVPVAIVGAEEQTINLGNIEALPKSLGLPSMPITPLTPLLGPLAVLPAPVKYRVYFGPPLHFDGDPNDDEAVIAAKVAEVKLAIARMVEHGLATRRGILV